MSKRIKRYISASLDSYLEQMIKKMLPKKQDVINWVMKDLICKEHPTYSEQGAKLTYSKMIREINNNLKKWKEE